MNFTESLEVYKAQTVNVRGLVQARKHVKRAIHDSLRHDQFVSATMHTRLYVLVYTAWIEASFSKMIHTPYGFSLNEISQIKEIQRYNGIAKAWSKTVEIGIGKVAAGSRSNYLPNVSQRIQRIIDDYIEGPSIIRNKIAHGQWNIALNRANDAVNQATTSRVGGTDVVQVDIWFEVAEKLVLLVENLVESPQRTFNRDYWTIVTEIDDFIREAQSWSLQHRVALLKRKKSYWQQ